MHEYVKETSEDDLSFLFEEMTLGKLVSVLTPFSIIVEWLYAWR